MDAYFSVIMPTYNQASFIRRAILSLQRQTYPYWELIIINDGCTDDTEMFISDFLSDERIVYIKNESNKGLGHALNQGLRVTRNDLIAYLPSDDYYFEDHLESIYKKFQEYDDLVLVYTGMKYASPDTMCYTSDTESKGLKKGCCLQLVQTAHKRTSERWLERNEWVTEDLFAMFWRKLTRSGVFGMTNKVSCYWTQHSAQRHCIIGEKYGGGINKYRSYYKIQSPIKMKVSKYKFIDEDKLYESFRGKQKLCKSPLKILILGELAYNPERIYALEQARHILYGLWMQNPTYSFSTVGHLPFGHIEDIPFERWKQSIEEVKPDIIYGLLNFGAVPLAYDVLKAFPDIPFVWHFKEGPSVCLRNGMWNRLIYLYTHATGKIFLNEAIKSWFEQFLPPNRGLSFIMDGDLPKKDYFKNDFSSKLSSQDGAVHTLIAGRMIGISNNDLSVLIRNNIHIHLYTENYHACKEKAMMRYMQIAPKHFHIHSHVSADNWTKEFSQYDAGWLHCFKSRNNGDLLKATWDDLNIPARISTYAAAGLPVIFPDNSKHVAATQEIAERLDVGIFFHDFYELSNKLKEQVRMKQLTDNMHRSREIFSFDYYVPQLVQFFRDVIRIKKQKIYV